MENTNRQLPKTYRFREILAMKCKREWIKPGFALGSLGALVSDDPNFTTQLALQMAVDVACGRGVDKGGVLYVAAACDNSEIERRLQDIVHSPKIGLTDLQIKEVVQNFQGIPLWGKKFDFEEIAKDIVENVKADFQDGAPLRLVIFDSLLWFAHGRENDNRTMSLICHSLSRISEETGASCLMLHTAQEGVDLLLTDYARYQEDLFSGKDDEHKHQFFWQVSKHNYSPPIGGEKWYKYGADQVLVPVEKR